jgi:hypothetical protein
MVLSGCQSTVPELVPQLENITYVVCLEGWTQKSGFPLPHLQAFQCLVLQVIPFLVFLKVLMNIATCADVAMLT